MPPHFKRFFRGMAQKDLLLSDVCLPFCGHSLLFFCRRFLFQIKRKYRNAESIKVLIIVGRKSRRHIFIVPLTRQRCVESPHPTIARLQPCAACVQEKLRILIFRRNAGPLRNDFLILFFYILSGTLILSSVRMFLRTSLTHRHRYILAALRSLSSQLTRQAL